MLLDVRAKPETGWLTRKMRHADTVTWQTDSIYDSMVCWRVSKCVNLPVAQLCAYFDLSTLTPRSNRIILLCLPNDDPSYGSSLYTYSNIVLLLSHKVAMVEMCNFNLRYCRLTLCSPMHDCVSPDLGTFGCYVKTFKWRLQRKAVILSMQGTMGWKCT